jgi:hypothetical protein
VLGNAPKHAHTIVGGRRRPSSPRRSWRGAVAVGWRSMSPTWIWLQAAIVVFVVIGMIIAITKLA